MGKQMKRALELAKRHGATCISEADEDGKFTWKCARHHVFYATYNQMQQKFQCKYCNKEVKNQNKLKEAQKIAQSRGGQCLSNVYPEESNHLWWKCEKNHRWPASFFSVKRGTWCQRCSASAAKRMHATGGRKRKTAEDARKLAASKNGEFLSPAYADAKTKYTWQCQNHHVWTATYNDIQQGTWCPECEKKTLADAQRLAEKKGGKLISTVFVNCAEKLIWQCEKKHTWPATFSSVQSGSWCPHCAGNARYTIEQIQEIAKKRGGECLSDTYEGANIPLNWRCCKGHPWSTTLGVVLRGSWCRECTFTKRKKTIEDAKRLAEEKGGICLSAVYQHSKENLQWQCSKGHTWPAPYTRIQSGSWCPECALEERRKRKNGEPNSFLLQQASGL